MNSTELYIAAGEAIKVWGMNHVGACVLILKNGLVSCRTGPGLEPTQNNPLYISHYEVQNGMPKRRWDEIGTELFNLQNKELACQSKLKETTAVKPTGDPEEK